MKTIILPLLATLAGLLQSCAVLHLEIVALRQQLAIVTARDRDRLRFRRREHLFWVCFYRLWSGCLETLAIFKAETLVRWHRKGFRLYWIWKSRRNSGGRPRSPRRPETSVDGSLRMLKDGDGDSSGPGAATTLSQLCPLSMPSGLIWVIFVPEPSVPARP
jgi:hypothetical protein